MKLDRYFARRYATSFLSVAGIFFVLVSLADLVEQARTHGAEEGAGLGDILALTLLNAPGALYELLPLLVILAGIALFLGLARSSEMVVTRAAGRSALRALVAPVAVVALIAVLALLVLNPLAAATSREYEARAQEIEGTGASIISVDASGLWLRQGGEDGQTVIRASRANLDGTQLFDVTILGFALDGTATSRIEAAEAALVPGAWELRDAKEWRFAVEGNIERAAVVVPAMRIPSDLTRDEILDSFGEPSAVPIWDLPEFIARLESAGFSATAHRVFFQMELATPFLLVAMVLVGAGFTMRHARLGRTGVMVLMALGMGFTLYFIRNFAQILGENGQIPVLLAAWGPPVAAILLPLGLLLHLEDG